MDNVLTVSSQLMNGKMQYRSSFKGFPDLITDYPPPHGDNTGPCSLEIFLVSLATCAGNAITHILLKMHKEVTDFSISATGTKRTEHPMVFESIRLEIRLQSGNTSQPELEKAIGIAEEKICPVWNMIKASVPVVVVATIESPRPALQD